jgi:large repetitive protein
MKRTNISRCVGLFGAGLLAVALAACQSTPSATTQASAAPKPAPAANLPTIRVKAGADADLTDSKGVVWKADTGFEGGSTIDRPDLQVTGTDNPAIYHSEHYGMDSWSAKVPNGKYVLKLHFSEDYDGIASGDDRVFDYTVKDGDAATGTVVKAEKGFSPWKKAGAQYKAYVDSVPVNVTKGAITVVFTPSVENPQINAIEVVPQ